jgi:putative sterol carrier protein
MPAKSYGSGHFGEWITDQHGLPAYRYTCDQDHDPRAVTPVSRVWRSPTDHSHQVGNDRLVAVASNYGYVQVRQDEGAPKFLNDYDPTHGQFAGGFGYLTDGETSLSTFYPGGAETFDRVFGIGYFRKTASRSGYTVDQVIFAPFGDVPLLISQVTVTNRRAVPADLRWIEHWGCQMYQFSDRAWVLATIKRKPALAASLRRELASRFTHRFKTTSSGAGLVDTQRFLGWRTADKVQWASAQVLMGTLGRAFTGGMIRPPVKEAGLDDFTPPPTFLVSLDAPADGLSTNGPAFFGKGGLDHPDGLAAPLNHDLSASGLESAMFLERRLHLEPGASRTLYFAYGYLPEGFGLETLLAGCRQDLPHLWEDSSAAWKKDRIRLVLPGEDWVDRELAWHHYYLRSSLTYDSFFKEHILSQGAVYQYVIGFQGAARDPLQHALPFLFTHPETVKEVLRYTLKEVTPEGEIPYALTGRGMKLPAPFRPSDQELWLLWLASEYVLATHDAAFLDEQLPTYPLYGPEAGKATVGELLQRCYHHLVGVTGVGQHGLLRLSNGDWNDLVVIGYVPDKQRKQVKQVAESVLNSAMAAYVLDLYALMLAGQGQAGLVDEICRMAENMRKAVRSQWGGSWFRRAWLTPELGWVGDEQLWLEPQPWAILGGSAAPDQIETLVKSVDDEVRQGSPVGARLLGKGVNRKVEEAGEGAMGGIWPSINGTLVWALAMVDGEMAWDEWKKNSLAAHAEVYPDIWYGIWSGPDTLNSSLSKYAGQTAFDERFAGPNPPEDWFGLGANWTDFPVMNLHPHAWQLYSLTKLVGASFTPQGLDLAPALPQAVYRFESPLVGLEKSGSGYSGWYAPAAAGTWRVTLHLPGEESVHFTHLEVNGHWQPLAYGDDGALQWSGEGAPGQPLRWSLAAGAPAVRQQAVTQPMSGKERVLAALQGLPVDHIPFVPLIDTYSTLDFPPEVLQRVQAASSQGYWQGMLQALRETGCDVMLRHVDVSKPFDGSPHLNGLGRFEPPVRASSRMEGTVLYETLETPVGSLTGTWGFTDRHGWIPHPVKHMVSSLEELKIFDCALDHLSRAPLEPDDENFLNAEKAIGEDGIPTASLLNTPLMHLIETCWGLENTYYLLNDYRSEVEGILDKLYRAQLKTVERAAASPARVVIQYENTSSTLLSPQVFRRYCLPYLNEYADILRSAGKIFLVHMCGKLEAFCGDLAAGHFDGIADISPQPTGNFTLNEAAACLGGKIVVGGIDATTFIEPDLRLVETRVAGLLRRVKPYPGVLLGSADTAPRGTPLETFRLVNHLVDTLGSYLPNAEVYRPGQFLASLGTPAKPWLAAAPAAAPDFASPGKLEMSPILQELTRRLDGKRPEVSGVIKFNVTGDCVYRLFIDAGKCRLELSEGPADASMTATPENLVALFTGKLTAMSAFMARKIKFDGNLKLLGVLTAAQE